MPIPGLHKINLRKSVCDLGHVTQNGVGIILSYVKLLNYVSKNLEHCYGDIVGGQSGRSKEI